MTNDDFHWILLLSGTFLKRKSYVIRFLSQEKHTRTQKCQIALECTHVFNVLDICLAEPCIGKLWIQKHIRTVCIKLCNGYEIEYFKWQTDTENEKYNRWRLMCKMYIMKWPNNAQSDAVITRPNIAKYEKSSVVDKVEHRPGVELKIYISRTPGWMIQINFTCNTNPNLQSPCYYVVIDGKWYFQFEKNLIRRD